MKLCLQDSGPISSESNGYTYGCTTCPERYSKWIYDEFAGTERWEKFRTDRVVFETHYRVEYDPRTRQFEWYKR